MQLQNRKTRLLILGVLLAAIVGLFTCYPLREPRLPHGTDTLVHLYGLVSLDTLVQQGILYSRWMPYKASGFGSPFFHYYAPLSFYVAQVFCVLGTDAVTALRLALGLALIGAAVGMYHWARDAFGVPAGLVAATAYVCAPYLLYNVYFRGGIGEHYALMLMPWTLSALHRLRHTGCVQDLLLSAFGYAGVILAHNLTALIFTPMLGGYALALTLNSASPSRQNLTEQLVSAWGRRPWFRLATAIGLGLALSAFFWLPLAAEQDAIHQTLLYTGDEFDYRTHFLGPDALLTDTAPGLALYPITVGLAAFGLLMTLWRDPAQRWETSYITLIAIGCTLITLPAAVVVWDALPLLRYFQFPHRFLGVATLCLAFLAGGAVHALRPTRLTHHHRSVVTVASSVAPVIVLLLLLRPINALAQVRYYPELSNLDVNFVMRKDREAGNIFSTYTISFVPITVQEPPPFALLARNGPERLDTDALPPKVATLAAEYTPLRYTLKFSAAQPFTATFNTFYFPGWKARLDRSPAPIVPAVPHGRISVALPAGQHNLVVWFGTTPLRTCANGTSLLALAGVAITLIWHEKRRRNEVKHEA